MADPIQLTVHTTGDMMKPPYVLITPDIRAKILEPMAKRLEETENVLAELYVKVNGSAMLGELEKATGIRFPSDQTAPVAADTTRDDLHDLCHAPAADKPASGEIAAPVKGDYVLATKYEDGEAWDWCGNWLWAQREELERTGAKLWDLVASFDSKQPADQPAGDDVAVETGYLLTKELVAVERLDAEKETSRHLSDIIASRDAAIKDLEKEIVEATRQKDVCRLESIKLRDMLEASKNGHWYGRMITAETQAVDLKQERDAARAEADALRRDLCEIADGCGVGHPDQAEAKRRIIAIAKERDALKARKVTLPQRFYHGDAPNDFRAEMPTGFHPSADGEWVKHGQVVYALRAAGVEVEQ
jgi:hypothetical protein